MVAHKFGIVMTLFGAAAAAADEGFQLLQLGAEKKVSSQACKDARQTLATAKSDFKDVKAAKLAAEIEVEENCEAKGSEPHLDRALPTSGAKWLTGLSSCDKGWLPSAEPDGGSRDELGHFFHAAECHKRCNMKYQEIKGFNADHESTRTGREKWGVYCMYALPSMAVGAQVQGVKGLMAKGTQCYVQTWTEKVLLKREGQGQFMTCAVDPLTAEDGHLAPLSLQSTQNGKPDKLNPTEDEVAEWRANFDEWMGQHPHFFKASMGER